MSDFLREYARIEGMYRRLFESQSGSSTGAVRCAASLFECYMQTIFEQYIVASRCPSGFLYHHF